MTPPNRPYRALRAGVGASVIAVVVALWAHGQLTGDELGTLWEVVVLAIILAGGYSVFGHSTMSAAVDDAQELADGADDEEGDGQPGVAETPETDPRGE
ncbi:hypothetical protein [Halorubrum lacusprofundi]|jgi:hypothetical protein|uniref:Uncharacterized protein n=2 Tax=Halorubrum lacusprofundi TaxID=2247 RepID=B9LUK7_HALLT|nr:hypothetical protein [Halorubrum lacusprofundi]ACM56364.1 hypothetical protein Hlac_0764 [Halorubrum lacusprofundi ATCC 49239]